MTRLNEPIPPPPEADSLETLKRKFLRQNRDIAKVNSAQAIRIRALESEVARLLTDNLNTRGHVIRLERELESTRSRHQRSDDLRSQMQNKLAELQDLFKDFDGRPSPKKRKSASPKQNLRCTPVKSPGTKDWKNGSVLVGATSQESRFPPSLPAIIENKYYPRRTLEQDELLALSDPTESPDLEPPPLSDFIQESVKFDLPVKTTEVPRESPSSSTAMLDQRRKRRQSVGIADIRRISGEVMLHEETPDSLKVGAKRKVSVRDEDERSNTSQTISDDFKYTRKSDASKSTEIAPAKNEGSREKSKSIASHVGRKALAPKASNEDLKNIPHRNMNEISAVKKQPLKSSLQSVPSRRAPTTENIPPVAPKIDVLSEAKTQHDMPKPETATMPPPTGADPKAVTDHSRPGRRAKSSVSYAEPNLRDKMRRPTKEFVDAVSAASKQGAYIKIEDEAANHPKGSSDAVFIKKEDVDHDVWNVPAQASSNAPPNAHLERKSPPSSPHKTTVHDAEERRSSSNEAESAKTRKIKIEKGSDPPTKPTRSAPSAYNRTPLSLDRTTEGKEETSYEDPDSLEPTAEKIRQFVRKEEEEAASRARDARANGALATATGLRRKDSSSKRNSALPVQMQVGGDDGAGEDSDAEGPGGAKRRTKAGSGGGAGRISLGHRGGGVARRKSVAVLADADPDAAPSGAPAAGGVSAFARAGRGRREGGEEKGLFWGRERERERGREKEKETEKEEGGGGGGGGGVGARQERMNARRRSMVV